MNVRDHSQSCKHNIPDVDGFTWQDDSGNWFCDEIGCPGGREIMLRRPDWYGKNLDGGREPFSVWVEVNDG